MKKVLGLDLGTTSIGWAMVNQAENNEEKSSIIRAGVRVNPLTTDEKMRLRKVKPSPRTPTGGSNALCAAIFRGTNLEETNLSQS